MKILNTKNKNKQENNHYGKKVIVVLPIFLVCWKLSQLKNFTIFWCLFTIAITVATLLWVKWEDETPTPKVGDLESSETPECLEFDSKG
jgi:hypothetical protein